MNDQVEKQTVLVVDDTPANIKVLMEILKDDYRIVAAVNGQRAPTNLTCQLSDLAVPKNQACTKAAAKST